MKVIKAVDKAVLMILTRKLILRLQSLNLTVQLNSKNLHQPLTKTAATQVTNHKTTPLKIRKIWRKRSQ